MELSGGLNVRKGKEGALVTPRCLAEAAGTGQTERSRAGGFVQTGQRWPCTGVVSEAVALWITELKMQIGGHQKTGTL